MLGMPARPAYALGVSTASHGKPSLLVRFTFDSEGNLKGGRLLAITGSIAMLVSLGTLVAVYLTNEVSPAAMTWWVTGVFVAVKIPLMAFFWWLLGTRNPNDTALGETEAREMIIRLRQRSLHTARYTDSDDRFEGLIAEATFVAVHAPEDVRPDADALVAEIEVMKAEAQSGP